MPSTRTSGYARAIPMLDHPQPHATSATRAGGFGPQARVHVAHCREPILPEQMGEERARERLLPLVEVDAVVLVRDPVAAAIRGHQLVERTDAAGEGARERRGVVEARLVQQRLVVTFGEAELAAQRVSPCVVDLEDARSRLLL